MKFLRVNYHWYYDLFFRTKYNFLVPFVYVIDFMDYVKANIAYNTRSYQLASRKISFFANVYKDLMAGESTQDVRTAIKYFYEDIFNLYKQYFKTTPVESLTETYVGFFPEFRKVSFLYDTIGLHQVNISIYHKDNLDEMLFNIGSPSIYSCGDKQIQTLSIAYDCMMQSDLIYEVINEYV